MFNKLKSILFVIFCCLSSCATASPVSPKSLSFTDVGQGDAILLIHAFPTDKRLWIPQQEGLKNHFRVIAIDLPGFGDNYAVSPDAITMVQYADYVKAVMDKLHLKKAIIGGESMGGYVALAFTKQYPAMVAGLILSDTQSIPDSDEAKAKREITAQDVLKNGTSDLINGFLPKALTGNASVAVRDNLYTMLASQSINAVVSATRGMALREDTTSVLTNTNLPILIITGSDDKVISPDQSQAMHAITKYSQLVILGGAAHLSNLEQPEQWNQAVINTFYNKH